MALDDIYQVKLNYENPTGSSSNRLYYREVIARSGIGTDTQVLAQSWDDQLSADLRGVVSDDFHVSSISVSKVTGTLEPKFRLDLPATAGLRPGPALPANNALLLGLHQSLFAARHNGSMFIPGVPEADTLTSVITAAFAAGQVTTLITALTAQLSEESGGTGRYDLGVINGLILNASPPIKDWHNAFSPVSTVSFNPIIADQKKRQTRAIGAVV